MVIPHLAFFCFLFLQLGYYTTLNSIITTIVRSLNSKDKFKVVQYTIFWVLSTSVVIAITYLYILHIFITLIAITFVIFVITSVTVIDYIIDRGEDLC